MAGHSQFKNIMYRKGAQDAKKAKSLIPLLVPLFVSSFRRADELAVAMECKCYSGGKNRTHLHVLKTTYKDYISVIIIILLTVGIILINFI